MSDTQLNEAQVEEEKFDFDAFEDERIVPAVKGVFHIFGKHANSLNVNFKQEPKVLDAVFEDIAQDVMAEIASHNVTESQMQTLMDYVQTIIQTVFTKFTRHKNELDKELLARVKGSENPSNGKLSNEYATLGDLFNTLNKFRTEQDVDGESRYFILEKNK